MKKWNYLCRAAVVSALYVVLTFVSAMLGLSSGVIQVRISEALCILPVFMPQAIFGLALGCFISNLLVPGSVFIDAVFGSIATLIGAVGTYLLRNRSFLPYIPPIVSNAVIVPFVLQYAYGITDAYWYLVLTVGLGEIISVGFLGCFFRKALLKNKFIFK